MAIKAVLSLAKAGLSIANKKLKVKYQSKVYKLEKERDEILEVKYFKNGKKRKTDRNKLDRVDRNIVRLGRLVAAEIQGS